MGMKCVVLSLAMCLVLTSFHEVSCQVEGDRDVSEIDISTDHRTYRASVQEKEEEVETQSIKRESDSVSSWEQNTTGTEKKKIYVSLSEEIEANEQVSLEAEAVSSREVGQNSSMMDEINREIEAHLGSLNNQAGSDGVKKVGESKDSVEYAVERRKQLEEIERQMEAAAATKLVVEEGTTKRKSRLETHDIKFEVDESAEGESRKSQKYYGKTGDEESAKGSHVTNKAHTTESEYKKATSTESRQQSSSGYDSLKKSNGGSRMLGSLGIAQSGAWRCVNQDKNGVTQEEDVSIVIPQYNINDIIKEESTYQGSASKTSSLVESLTQIVEKHRKEKWSPDVTATESSQTVQKLKVELKKYRAISARELVTRSDFEEILTRAARYEELSSASVSYISRLSMYRSVIKEGIKASQRAQLAQARAKLLKEMALEKQKHVDAEFALVKALAERGDMLYVKIFAIKKLVLKLEAEKEEVDMNFQKIVENLSRVLEEASKAYEEYHVVVRKWKEEQAAEEFSREAIESAEVVWVQFLSTL